MLNRLFDVLNPKTLYSQEQLKPTTILLLSALLPALHRYFGSMSFARLTFPFMSELEAATFMFTAAFVLMGLLPLAMVRFVFREPLRSYGLCLGDWRRALPATMILFVVIAGVFIYPASKMPDMRAVFPFDKNAGESVVAFLRFELLRGLFFYSAWEFFFRGFVLFGLRKHLGDWIAICIQTIPSCLWHIGMPSGETFSSVVAGVMFGILAIRSRSIIYVFVLHYMIGIILDLFIVMTA
jgi:membrane protease YdiL (CAAX protease family)